MIHCYVIADFGGDKFSRKSTSGFIMRFFSNPVAWCSRLLWTIAVGSVEVEYMAICEAAHEISFLTHLYKEVIGPIPHKYIKVAHRLLAFVTIQSWRVKLNTFELKYLKTREHYKNNILKNVEVDSKTQQAADFLTNSLLVKEFEILRSHLVNNWSLLC